MYEAAARNLRTAERYLLAPPLAATFGGTPVHVCDISEKGARFRHDSVLETGTKAVLKVATEMQAVPVQLEAVVVWSHADTMLPGKFVSGVRTYGAPEIVSALLAHLQTSHRTNRIEELRSTDRFVLTQPLAAMFAGRPVLLENLSVRGARIESMTEPVQGRRGLLQFRIVDPQPVDITVTGEVVWTAVKSIDAQDARTYRAGLSINERPEVLRLAIGQLCERNRAVLDTLSLRLKLKIMRARARQFAPNYRAVESSGVPAEQFVLIQGVREELRLNPEEAMHWYRRARVLISDPNIRKVAPVIADHPDALAVWEYLDRSVDPSIVGRAFELPVL